MHAAFLVAAAVALADALIGLLTRRGNGGAEAARARICTPAEIDVLVTDAGIAAEDAARLQDAGVDVVTA